MTNSAFSKLKIFHFISGDLWAGAETMALNLLRRLKDYDDLDISVILFNEGRLASELRASGLNIHIIDENLHSFWEILRIVWNIIGSNRTDIIHSHRYKENILAFLVSRCCRGIKLVSTQHGLPEFLVKKASITMRIKIKANFFFLSRHFRTVAVSEDIRKALVNCFGFRKEKVEVILNGIEIPSLISPRGWERPFVIGSSGRLFPVKDYPLMVEIARSISAAGAVDVRFELAGDGPERPSLEDLLQKHALNASFFLKGHLDDMNSFYQDLDIYLNTSIHEGIPMTILEALAHGLPVVAPAVGGIVEIIEDGRDGFLVTSRNPDDFARKCMLLKEDRVMREKMSCAAREKAETSFSAESMAEKYYRLYRRAV